MDETKKAKVSVSQQVWHDDVPALFNGVIQSAWP
jgi:hypothetical protein